MLGALVLLLAGCSKGAPIALDAPFDPAAAAGDGLVVVGLRVAREPVRHVPLLGDFAISPTYTVSFVALTPDGKIGRVSRQVQICDSLRPLFYGALSDCRPADLQFKVLRVPAGQYSLNAILYQDGKNTIVSSYVRPPSAKPDFWSPGPGTGDAVRDARESFAVAPGEIVYIGDLNFSFIPPGLQAHITLSRNDAAALRALSAYPNIHGSPIFRSATGGTSALPLVELAAPLPGTSMTNQVLPPIMMPQDAE